MDLLDHVTKFRKFSGENFFLIQNIFLNNLKILQNMIENVCQLHLSANFAKQFS